MASVASGVRDDYESLVKKLRDTSSLAGISGLLGWDEMVFLPRLSGECRAKQKSALAGVIHERSVDPELGSLLSRLEKADGSELSSWEAACVREAAKEYKKNTAVTEDLVRREAALESKGYLQWVKAREENDFQQFAPVLKEWIEIRKERAALVDPALSLIHI